MFKLAMVQMEVAGGQKGKNLARAEEMIARAAAGGADVVLLPEAMDLGWTHPSASQGADAIPDGATCRRLRDAARRHQLYLCSGLVERDGEQVYNSAVLIDPRGEVLLRHRKLNELEIGHPYYAQGDRLGVAHTPLGTIGVMICADAFAQDFVISRTLGYMGAGVILSPCAWAVPGDHDNEQRPYGGQWRDRYQPVAKDFNLYIAGASKVGWLTDGPWQGWKCIGCSLLIGPDGEELAFGPYGHDAETILFAEIEPRKRPARGTQWPDHWARGVRG